MKIAILYQAKQPPKIDGIDKPMKKGGYRDSGADIGFCLKMNHYELITPVNNPDEFNDLDWVFPDTDEGIQAALDKGADTFWTNTVLYATHPITHFKNIYIIGQDPSFVESFDDKFSTNQILIENNLSVAKSQIIDLEHINIEEYPCVIKPIRGRGSQGVKVCDNKDEAISHMQSLLKDNIYGDHFMVEPFLDGKEITVGVFPDGTLLPAVERIMQIDRIMPYNGKVPVTQNSFVAKEDETIKEVMKDCQKAVELLKPKALIRIDCREKNGKYYMFDLNPKPNMTGAVRSHRGNQDSLLMIACKSQGLEYIDLLKRFIDNRWYLK